MVLHGGHVSGTKSSSVYRSSTMGGGNALGCVC